MTTYYVDQNLARIRGLVIDDHVLILCSPTHSESYGVFNLHDYVYSGFEAFPDDSEDTRLHFWLSQLAIRLIGTKPDNLNQVYTNILKNPRRIAVYNVTQTIMTGRINELVCEPMDLFEVILLFPDAVLLTTNVATFSFDNSYWMVVQQDDVLVILRALCPNSLWKNPPEPKTVEKIVEKIVEVEKPVEVKATRRRSRNQKTIEFQPEVVDVPVVEE